MFGGLLAYNDTRLLKRKVKPVPCDVVVQDTSDLVLKWRKRQVGGAPWIWTNMPPS